jgi:hypothetical protein
VQFAGESSLFASKVGIERLLFYHKMEKLGSHVERMFFSASTTAWAWKTGGGSLPARLHDTLVILAALACTWQTIYFNLTVFHL